MHRTPALARQSLRASSQAHLHALRASCLVSTTKRCYATPPPPETHYDFFPTTLPRGAPPTGPFAVDARALRTEFLKQQAAAHPDRHPGGEAKRRAEALSARINEAYKVLADPLLRTQYILSLQGVDVAGDETAKVEDQDLLLEVLEAREVIEGAQGEAEVRALQEENQMRLDQTVRAVEEAVEKGDWEGAKSEAVRLRYWVNIREACVNWEPGKPVTLQH